MLADDIALEPHRIHERLEADKHRRDMVGHEADVAAYEEQRATPTNPANPDESIRKTPANPANPG